MQQQGKGGGGAESSQACVHRAVSPTVLGARPCALPFPPPLRLDGTLWAPACACECGRERARRPACVARHTCVNAQHRLGFAEQEDWCSLRWPTRSDEEALFSECGGVLWLAGPRRRLEPHPLSGLSLDALFLIGRSRLTRIPQSGSSAPAY